jgi:hypothetical protein
VVSYEDCGDFMFSMGILMTFLMNVDQDKLSEPSTLKYSSVNYLFK